MSTATKKISLGEKVGYSLGDSSANFVFQIMIMFQLGFYTDVFGLKTTTAGMVLLIARFADALVDPAVGILSDRTNTRWGKYRPWILWTAIPFGLFFWMAFTTPDLGERAKVIYAGVTYTLLMAVYSFSNTPYSALHGVMTSNIKERTNIASIRFVFAMAAAFVVQGFTLPLVAKFGQGDDQKGWSMAIGLFAIVAVIFLIITFFSAKERITPPAGQKTSIKQDVKDVFSSKPWKAMFALTLFLFTTLALWGGGMYYYFNYYVEKEALFTFIKSIGLVNTPGEINGWGYYILDLFGLIALPDFSNAFNVGFSLFNMLGQLVTIAGVILLSQPLANRFGKRNTFIAGLALSSLFTALFFVIPPENVGTIFILNILKSAAYAPTIPLLWAMMGDVADFGEYTNSRRSTGFVFAGIVFALKAGLGIGGAICGWFVDLFGFVPNAIQTPSAIIGIKLTASLVPALTFAIGMVALFFYPISKSLNEKVQAELNVRRGKQAEAMEESAATAAV